MPSGVEQHSPAVARLTAPTDDGDRALDAGAAVVAGAAFGLAALGVRVPATGALGNLVLTLAWYCFGYTSSIVHVPYLVAFYLLGTTGDRRRQIGVGGIAVVGASVAMVAGSDESAASAASAAGWTLVALLCGELTRPSSRSPNSPSSHRTRGASRRVGGAVAVSPVGLARARSSPVNRSTTSAASKTR